MTYQLSSRIDRDKLNTLKRERITATSFSMLNQIRDEPGELLLASVATAFAAMCERYAEDPEELFRMGQKILRPEPHHDKANVQLEAFREFCGLRINNNPTI
jgi:hypothetical protein